MIELTHEQHQALHNHIDPVEVLDRASNTEYVLIRREVYQWWKELLEDDDARLMGTHL